jgi:hypothetical protein
MEPQSVGTEGEELEAERRGEPCGACLGETVAGAGDELLNGEHDRCEQRERERDAKRSIG